ncbi:hypothetical protein MTO96_018883 [Rhipicephalus appendiculatus]
MSPPATALRPRGEEREFLEDAPEAPAAETFSADGAGRARSEVRADPLRCFHSAAAIVAITMREPFSINACSGMQRVNIRVSRLSAT